MPARADNTDARDDNISGTARMTMDGIHPTHSRTQEFP